MNGPSFEYVVIPVVSLLLLAFWLYGMYHADSHPGWKTGPDGVGQVRAYVPPQVESGGMPRQVDRTESAEPAQPPPITQDLP
jgi:hypothetical protein